MIHLQHRGFYNFNKIKWAEIIAGGNYRQFKLVSKGTIFDEAPDPGRNYKEFLPMFMVAMLQIAKTLVEKFKVTGSLRCDKLKDFKGHITPRASVVYSADKNHNIRLSYQTGLRFPTSFSNFFIFRFPEQLPWVVLLL
ncbi:MAG: TonB-dependent receptor [Saprospiraceae bacterium]|nr:TonB-dependent receptor [Saprospiraceae bacterium]